MCLFSLVSAALPRKCALRARDGGGGGRVRRYFVFYSAVERKPKSWTRSVISAQNNDTVQPGTPRGSACLVVAALTVKLSNTKQRALNQQTTVPELRSRTMSFVCLEASVVSWAHCWSAWFVQHEDMRIKHFLQYSRTLLALGIPTAVTSQEGGLPIQKGIKWKTWHQKKGKLSIGSISPVYCRPALCFDAAHCSWYQLGDHAWVWLAEPIFLEFAGPCSMVPSPFPPCLTESGWIVWLLLAHIQALSSCRTQAVAHIRRLDNVTFCLCQGMAMSSEIQKLPWTFLPSLVLFTTWVYLGRREMNQNWLRLYLAL